MFRSNRSVVLTLMLMVLVLTSGCHERQTPRPPQPVGNRQVSDHESYLGVKAQIAHDWKSEIIHAQKAVLANPSDMIARIHLANVYKRQGKTREAVAEYKTVEASNDPGMKRIAKAELEDIQHHPGTN